MMEDAYKIEISGRRWAGIMEFLLRNESAIKSLLWSVVHPDMVYSAVELDNVSTGELALTAGAIFPNPKKNSVLLVSLARPPFYNPLALRNAIDQTSINDIILGAANQIQVIPGTWG